MRINESSKDDPIRTIRDLEIEKDYKIKFMEDLTDLKSFDYVNSETKKKINEKIDKYATCVAAINKAITYLNSK